MFGVFLTVSGMTCLTLPQFFITGGLYHPLAPGRVGKRGQLRLPSVGEISLFLNVCAWLSLACIAPALASKASYSTDCKW